MKELQSEFLEKVSEIVASDEIDNGKTAQIHVEMKDHLEQFSFHLIDKVTEELEKLLDYDKIADYVINKINESK